MAEKWVTIQGGTMSVLDKTFPPGVHKVDTDDERGKALVKSAENYDWVKVSDDEPTTPEFTAGQLDFLRKMFPQLLEPATAQQKYQQEYERLQAEKIAKKGPGANPDTEGVLVSPETRAAERQTIGPGSAFDGDAKGQPDYDAVKAEIQLAGVEDETAAYEAARQVPGAEVSADAPADESEFAGGADKVVEKGSDPKKEARAKKDADKE